MEFLTFPGQSAAGEKIRKKRGTRSAAFKQDNIRLSGSGYNRIEERKYVIAKKLYRRPDWKKVYFRDHHHQYKPEKKIGAIPVKSLIKRRIPFEIIKQEMRPVKRGKRNQIEYEQTPVNINCIFENFSSKPGTGVE
jgi:hypothetical protein